MKQAELQSAIKEAESRIGTHVTIRAVYRDSGKYQIWTHNPNDMSEIKELFGDDVGVLIDQMEKLVKNGKDMIIAEKATVYRALGKRFFTKRAAANRIANQLIKTRCCCVVDHETGYYAYCKYHESNEWSSNLKDRLIKFLSRTRFQG